MRVPWKMLMLLFFTLFMALGMSFERQKSGNRVGYVSAGQSAVPDVLPDFFVYICPHLIFYHSRKKKKKSQRKQISSWSLEAKSMQCIRLRLWSPSTDWRVGLKQNWYTDWNERINAHILLAAALAAGTEKDCQVHGEMCGTGWKGPEEAVQSPQQLERALGKRKSWREYQNRHVRKVLTNAGYYTILQDKTL